MCNIDHITVLMCANAAGRVLPSFLIYPKNYPTMSAATELPKTWLFGISPNGYIDKELFVNWFNEIFLKHCGSERPIVLIVDNHDSHISYDLLQTAKQNQVCKCILLIIIY